MLLLSSPAKSLRLSRWHMGCSSYGEDWCAHGCIACVGAQVTCSMASGQFGADQEVYYVLGTAYLVPEELEPSRVRCNRPCPSAGPNMLPRPCPSTGPDLVLTAPA